MGIEIGWIFYAGIAAAVSTGFLLMALALNWATRPRERPGGASQANTDPTEVARQEFRARNGVRALLALEEGFGLTVLPNGVFGFTFTPAYEDSPVFRERRPHSFEVHKLRDGKAFLLGFASAGDAESIDNCPLEAHVSLHPQASECAPKLVCIPSSRIARYKDYRPGGSAGMEIMVVPPGLKGMGATPPSFRLERPIPAAPRAF